MSSHQPGHVDAAYLEAAATQTVDANARAVAVLGLRPGGRVLDVGCGAGDGLSALMVGVGAAGCVVGVDHDGVLLAVAAGRALPGGPTLRCVTADVAALPFDDASFDAVTCRYVLQHLAEPGRAVSEMVRVLRPGGTLSILDADWASVSIAGGDVDMERRLMTLNATALLRNGTAGRQLPGLLRRAGLIDVQRRSFAEVDDDLPLVREMVVLTEIEDEAVARGVVTADEISRWRRDLELSAAQGTFLALSTAVLAWGTRAPPSTSPETGSATG